MASYQFDPSLISPEIAGTLPSDFKARPLEAGDQDKGKIFHPVDTVVF
jgi:hypothetical protein